MSNIQSTILVTGGTSGLGQATAANLARAGHRVIIVGRDAQKGRVVETEMRSATQNPNVEFWACDLSRVAPVRALAAQCEKQLDRLDVLVNNAALVANTRRVTPDGLESMFAANHLAPFLLTYALQGMLTASHGRVLMITAPSTVKLDFENLQGEKKFSAFNQLGATKMCNLLFTFTLARRTPNNSFTVNAVHPGIFRSNLMRDAIFPIRFFSRYIGSTPDKAAEYVVHAATGLDYSTHNGQFFHKGKIIQADAYAHDPQIQDRLWQTSLELASRK